MDLNQMKEKIENDGIYLSEEDALTLSQTDFTFSLEETNRARAAQAAMFATREGGREV
ncbi:MAG: hypothetical protein IJ708_11175 [Clostridia bacterium]|nr:hypothetical protein [Clostridia bacterium]